MPRVVQADYTVDELMCACIARRLADGDIALQGIATSLVAAGYVLAKLTHAPNLRIASAIGQGICQEWLPLGLARAEELWLGKAMATAGLVTAAVDLLPRLHPVEYFRPAQIDPHGNFNNIAIGQNLRQPRLRLPGTGGIPDVSVLSKHVHLYVPRHSRAVFVPVLDACSGLGHSPLRRQGGGPVYLLTDLGQFDFAGGLMRLVTVHPGVSAERVQARTGFDLVVAPDLYETPPPTAEEIRLLREDIDPLGVRKLETLGGQARKALLRDILAREQDLASTS
ncbi:MAG: ketoacid-CoA transferase [Anaerolineae bacterium]|nr:ketoacid-CoA transferase [Anaerolineae bacterium]